MDMNLDLKDVIAKIKSGGGKNKDARKSNSITKFFEKNPKMKIIIPALIVVIALVVAILIIVSGVKENTDLSSTASSGQAVVVLPQIERSEGVTVADGVDPFSEDVIANATITGIIYNSDGYRTAIVETKYSAYTVQVGDYVGDSQWLVQTITDSTVTFSLGEKTRTIKMD